ncbi:unnamed protein product [Cladocopium goreaui]|uniref:Methyltransferase FkbM domain-containing protein n=1 Tax=Cladocopium goreaui TaxID=2562237 RepID=A0A9P1BV86_9DINO|nr:unnamed protein product [Cladocopium goreaui]
MWRIVRSLAAFLPCCAKAQIPGLEQTCDARPISKKVEDWCDRSCTQLLAFLRMRADFEAIDFNVYKASDAMNTWSSCPTAHRGILLARIADQLRKLPQGLDGLDAARRLLMNTEYIARAYVMDINITGYLASGTSYAPWFHMGIIHHLITDKYPEIFDMSEPQGVPEGRQQLLQSLEHYLSLDAPDRPLKRGLTRGSLSSLDMAVTRFAEADFIRITRAPGVLGHGGEESAERAEMERLLSLGQKHLQQAYRHNKARAPPSWSDLHGVLTTVGRSQVPLFDILDRLDSQVIEGIHLRDSVTHESKSFLVHLLPTRNVESNHVRSVIDLHCDRVFRDIVAEHRGQPITVVEVGAHLGGCILHALTHSHLESRGLAIDAYAPAVDALRRTAVSNQMEERLTVVEQFVCADDDRKFSLVFSETGVLSQPGWEDVSVNASCERSSVVECRSLDSLLQAHSFDEVDILRLSVLGREYDALRSAERFLAAGKVKVVAASVLRDNYAPADMARMLLRYGYTLTFDASVDEEVLQILSDRELIPEGTLTLVARRANS